MNHKTLIMSLLLVVGGSLSDGHAQSQGLTVYQDRPIVQYEESQRGGSYARPPQEAYKVCEGKSAGSSVQITGANGETVTGTCQQDGAQLVLRPDRPRGNARNGRQGPPPEAYRACEGKSVSSASQFVNPRGETVRGICELENGTLVLRPDRVNRIIQ